MPEWMPVPGNNPLLVPDGTRLQVRVEAIRDTLDHTQPWDDTRAVMLVDRETITWSYLNPDAAPDVSEWLYGFEAGHSAGRAMVARERLRWLTGSMWTLAAVNASFAAAPGAWWWASAAAAVLCAAAGTRFVIDLHQRNKEALRA